MSDAEKRFKDDRRPLCKYSPKCYQKNKEHIDKYKHQPVKMFNIFNMAAKNKKRTIDDVKSEDAIAETSSRDKITKIESAVEETIEKQSSDRSEPIFHEIPSDSAEFIKEKFLVTMPKDFYSFWDFYNSNNKSEAFFKSIKLSLVGPFDVLRGKLPVAAENSDYLIHWRHFFDPPEFQTVLFSNESEYHIGYYRDSPEDVPCFIAANEGNVCTIKPMGENIFAAIISYVNDKHPVKNVFSKGEIDSYIKDLKDFAKKNQFSLEKNTQSMRKRRKGVVAKTFHEAGIVVPVSKSNVGYRSLAEDNDTIKSILKKMTQSDSDKDREAARAQLQPIITFANIATDECDFGAGLELGLDLFSYGDPILHTSAMLLLEIAYEMLNRDDFAEIAKAHLNNRRKGRNLSIAELS